MIRTILGLFLLCFPNLIAAQRFVTPFERSGGAGSATYFEAIDFYRQLDRTYKTIDLQQAGPTDVIHPLHVVYYSKDGSFDPAGWKGNKLVLFINNAIHPGEPDGIDACMMLLRDAAMGKIDVPDNIVLAVIPVFNIGGALNRGSYSRANQNGPEAYGFRGSAKNLDLNRDFIKMDARETRTLVRLFHDLDPDLFIDNHVSNGADYQHVMTLLTAQPDKQGNYTGKYLKHTLEPGIYEGMKQKGYDLVPYVNHWGHTPDKGWEQFYEPPRFASGFAALFGTFAFVPETHMLKPYKERVQATYALMETFIQFAGAHAAEIKEARRKERQYVLAQKELVIDWQTDTTKFSEIVFKGYEAAYKASEVSGSKRLYYDRDKPYTKKVPFYNKYKAAATTMMPRAYVIQQGWGDVIDRLKTNGVAMQVLDHDSIIELTVYRIGRYETGNRPFEGHYMHSKVQYTKQKEKLRLLKGDCMIPVSQPAKRYLAETLEPEAPDAFFAWGFFDAVLQQKEHYSDYIFEDEAASLLQKDAALKKLFEEKKLSDPSFTKDGKMQLEFIYKHSAYYEPVHMRYPVFRID